MLPYIVFLEQVVFLGSSEKLKYSKIHQVHWWIFDIIMKVPQETSSQRTFFRSLSTAKYQLDS
jgi:hypothetical protein